MNNRRRLALAIFRRHIETIGLAIPRHFDAAERMVVAEVQTADLHPIRGNLEWLDFDLFLGDRKHPARTEDRDTFCPRLALVLGIAGDDLRPLLGRVVL